jgi:two-component sensor histidine kinase
MAFISDITARKKAIAERETLIAELQKALAQQTVLLQEVHHRVKNNLQVISSLLHMQARTVSDSKAKEALNESQRRVLAMALIHQYLYGGKQLDHIDFAEYIRSLTGQLFSYYAESAPNITSHLQLSPVLMTIDQALPCGLVLNELVTNALKYAYPNGLAGVVSVQLEETAHNSIKLTVSDRGVGFPKGFDWKNSPSMGLAIVQVLAKQIGADLELKDFDGTTFVLTLPKSDKDAQNG